MPRTLRIRITYANVMSTLAVFIALGGGAWAVTGRPMASASHHGGTTAAAGHGNDVISACVNNGTGAARIVSRCRAGEHKVSWVSFNGHFESPTGNSALDVNDNGIKLTEFKNRHLIQARIELTAGGLNLIAVKDINVHASGDETNTVDGNSLSLVHGDQTSTVDKDLTSTVHGNESTTIDKNHTSTVHGNETTTIDKNRTTTVHQNETTTIGENRASTVGGASEDTVGGLMSESVGGDISTSVTGSQTVTIQGNSTVSAVGGTLDTTAGTILNNADLIQNASDGDLVNLADTNLTNHAGGDLSNSAGGALANHAGSSLTNQAATDLLNKAGHSLTNQAGGSLLDKAAINLTAQASGQAILLAPVAHLGCTSGHGAARLNDPVTVTSPTTGDISGASTTVFVC